MSEGDVMEKIVNDADLMSVEMMLVYHQIEGQCVCRSGNQQWMGSGECGNCVDA